VEEPSTASNWEVRAFNREVGFTPNSGRGLTLRKLTPKPDVSPNSGSG
jgi:hypothetical protein